MKLSTVVGLAIFALVAFRCAVGQQMAKEVVIEVKDALSQPSAAADRVSDRRTMIRHRCFFRAACKVLIAAA